MTQIKQWNILQKILHIRLDLLTSERNVNTDSGSSLFRSVMVPKSVMAAELPVMTTTLEASSVFYTSKLRSGSGDAKLKYTLASNAGTLKLGDTFFDANGIRYVTFSEMKSLLTSLFTEINSAPIEVLTADINEHFDLDNPIHAHLP